MIPRLRSTYIDEIFCHEEGEICYSFELARMKITVQYWHPTYTYFLYWQVYSILLNSKGCEKKKIFLPWRCPKIFIMLSMILLTIVSDQQIGSKAIETSKDGTFGWVVETGLYK
mgnify:CR=1 FL=1